jgi:hypothetical protein
MKFAKILFSIAGIYGLVVLLPLYFLEEKTGRDYPPAITHPEYYYGFVGAAIAFQIIFLIISQDPVRFRPMMLAGVVEKFTYGAAVWILYLQSKTNVMVLTFASIDTLLGILFLMAYFRGSTASREP